MSPKAHCALLAPGHPCAAAPSRRVCPSYLLGTCLGPLLSSHRWVRLFGVAATLSFMATYALYDAWFTSAWCFFAGVLSSTVLLNFTRKHWPEWGGATGTGL